MTRCTDDTDYCIAAENTLLIADECWEVLHADCYSAGVISVLQYRVRQVLLWRQQLMGVDG
jgi:hypothetical protein